MNIESIGKLLSYNFILAMIISIVTAGIAGYIGSLMISKRMALMSDALAHLALPGISIALVYGFDPSIGAIIFLLLGITLIWRLQIKTKLPTETITAIIFSSSLSIAFLFLPKEKMSEAILGNISKINSAITIITVITSLIIFLIIKTLYSKLILISISPDLAKVEGIKVNKLNFIYLICIATTVSLGVKIAGGLLTAALIAIPAATSRNLSSNLSQYANISIIISMLSSFLGLILSQIIGITAGPLIVIFNILFFISSLLIK